MSLPSGLVEAATRVASGPVPQCAILEQHPDEDVPVLRLHAYNVRLHRHEARGMCVAESVMAALGHQVQGHSAFLDGPCFLEFRNALLQQMSALVPM